MHGLHSKCSILWLSLVNFSFLSQSILKVRHCRHLSLPLLTSSSSPNPVPFPAGSPPSHLSLGLIWNILLYSLYPARCPSCFTCHGISSTFCKFPSFPCWVLREQGCLSCSLQHNKECTVTSLLTVPSVLLCKLQKLGKQPLFPPPTRL